MLAFSRIGAAESAQQNRRRSVSTIAVGSLISMATCYQPAMSQVLIGTMSDEFNTSTLDTGKWAVYNAQNPLGRTRWGLSPEFPQAGTNGFARFYLKRYFPGSVTYGIPANSGGVSDVFQGTLIYNKTRFYYDTGVKEVEARVRVPYIRTGVVVGFFAYGPPNDTRGDEIDFEFLGNLLPRTGQNGTQFDDLWLNIFNNATSLQTVGGDPAKINIAGLDWTSWNLYKTRYSSTSVQWYVNNVLVRSESNPHPDQAVAPYLNIWVPDSTIFPDAYYGGYVPSADPASNNSLENRYFDVDWVRSYDYPGTAAPASNQLDNGSATIESSDVFLSAAGAYSRNSSIALTFTGALDAESAVDLRAYDVTINGFRTPVEKSIYDPFTHTVTLQLKVGAFKAGDSFSVGCYDLVDAQKAKVSDQLTELLTAE